MIKFSEVHIGYNRTLLKSSSMELHLGSVYVLAGKNGSGKSTLLKSIAGQLQLLSGSITLAGQEVITIPKKELPSQLSFVPVQFPAMDYVQAQEFIAAGRSPYTNIFGKLTDRDKSSVDAALNTLKIEHLSDRFTSELSDGEKQLVAIAKVIAQEAPYILLDEPTAFLDYPNKNKVLALLTSIAKEMNKCILLSAHDIELCLDHCANFLIVSKEERALELLQNPTKVALIDSAFKD